MALDAAPFRAAQAAEGGRAVIRSDIAGQAVGLVDRDEELRFVGVLDAQVLALDAIHRAPHQPGKPPDAMIDVHHLIAGLQVGISGFWRFGDLAGAPARLGRRQPKISPSVSRCKV